MSRVNTDRYSSALKRTSNVESKRDKIPFDHFDDKGSVMVPQNPMIDDFDQVTLVDGDGRRIGRVSKQSFILAHAMMYDEHVNKYTPYVEQLGQLPIAMRHNKPSDVDSTHETAYPEGLKEKKQHRRLDTIPERRYDPPQEEIVIQRRDRAQRRDEERADARNDAREDRGDDDRGSRHSRRVEQRKDQRDDDEDRGSRHSRRVEQRKDQRDDDDDRGSRHSRRVEQRKDQRYDDDDRGSRHSRRVEERAHHHEERVSSYPFDMERSRSDRDREGRDREGRDREGRDREGRERHKSRKSKRSDKTSERTESKKAELRLELNRLLNNGLAVTIPSSDASLTLFEQEFERWTLFLIQQGRVQYIQTLIRVVGGVIYVVLKLMGAWWIEGWIVSLSNEIEDPVMHDSLDQLYIKHFGYSKPEPKSVLALALVKVTVMTVMANLTSQTMLAQFFEGKYGSTARPVPINVSPVQRITQPAPAGQPERPAEPANFGQGVLPNAMSMAARFMPRIIQGLSSGGGLGGILSSLFSGGQQPRPFVVTPPQTTTTQMPPFVQPSF